MNIRRSVTEHTSSPTLRRNGAWWKSVLGITLAGLAVGIVTQVLQGVLPDGWGVLANSGVLWALAAFAFGATMPSVRWATVGGATALVIASIVYYAAVDWFEGNGSDPRGAVIWSAAGILAGSVFGAAGHVAAHRLDHRHPALALISGVLIGEGIHLIWFAGNPDLRPAGIVELVVAAVILARCLARAPRTSLLHPRLVVLAVTIVSASAAMTSFKVIDAVFLAS